MSSTDKITNTCKKLVDQMDKSTRGWRDILQKNYYDRRLSPLITIASDYQSKVNDYMRLLDDYEHRIAALAGMGSTGNGIGERELER